MGRRGLALTGHLKNVEPAGRWHRSTWLEPQRQTGFLQSWHTGWQGQWRKLVMCEDERTQMMTNFQVIIIWIWLLNVQLQDKNLCSTGYLLYQSYKVSALPVLRVVDCPTASCSLYSGIPGGPSHNTPLVTFKNVFRCCQMLLVGTNQPNKDCIASPLCAQFSFL